MTFKTLSPMVDKRLIANMRGVIIKMGCGVLFGNFGNGKNLGFG